MTGAGKAGIFLLLLLSWLFPAAARSQEGSGYLEGKAFAYPSGGSSRDRHLEDWETLFAKWEQKAGQVQLTASLRAERLPSGQRGELAFDPADLQLRRSSLSLQDFWVRLPVTPEMDLQMGHFQLGWGKTDGYSPADAFLPRDLTDPFRDEKIPIWAVRLNGQHEALRYDTVLCPVTTPWRLPVLGSRFAPLDVDEVPQGTRFTELEDSSLRPGFLATRLLATAGDWDLGGWARYGVRPAPLLEFRPDLSSFDGTRFTIPITRRYAREWGVGGELSRVLGSWVVRGEVAALFSRDRDLGDAYIGALSVERSFGDDTLLVTFAGNARQTPAEPLLLFDRSTLPVLIAAWNRTETWGWWKLVFSMGFREWDYLAKAEISYNLNDYWSVGGGMDLPFGYRQGPYGTLSDARRAFLALRRSF